MSGRRRLAALLVALFAGLLSLVAGAASSQAAPGYTDHASISFSASGSCGHLTVSGEGFVSNEQVTITLHSKTYTLATVTTDSTGAFSAAVTLPAGVTGNHQITAEGSAKDSAKGKVTLSNCGTQGGNGTAGGGLSNTGVAVLSIAGLGVVLLGVGTFLVVSGRRRRSLV